jgi:hypothetical protein
MSAVIVGGMTLLELADLLVALATLGLDAPKLAALVDKLKAKGHPQGAPIPAEHIGDLRDGFVNIRPVTTANPLGDPHLGN